MAKGVPWAAGDDIVIRPATDADRDFMLALNGRLIANAVIDGIGRDNIERFQSDYTNSALNEPPPGSATLIAMDRTGKPLGYIHLEPSSDILGGAPAGYVSIVAVDETASGQGIGRRLMSAAEAWARDQGFGFLILDVFASNEPARDFYRRQGFREDSLRLRKSLGETES